MKLMKELGKKPALEFLFLFLGVAVLAGLGVALYFYQGLGFLLLLPVLLMILFVYAFFARYGIEKRKRLRELGEEFVHLFSFFTIFVGDGFNVYSALEKIAGFASERMEGMIRNLLHDIDVDKTVTPFLTFAAPFEDLSIREVLLSIYQMVDEGGSKTNSGRFLHLFSRLADDKYQKGREKKIGFLQTLGFLPLAGSGIAMLMLTIGVVEAMGGVLNGL